MDFEEQALHTLEQLLSEIAFMRVSRMILEPRWPPQNVLPPVVQTNSATGPDLQMDILWPGGEAILFGEFKSNGQPMRAREAIEQIQKWKSMVPGAVGVFIAPYISRQVAEMCRAEKIGAVDLSGNAWLTFGNVYIERSGRPNRYNEQRELRSLFTPKASRVIRVLLENPHQSWQVQSIAQEAGVSIGQASWIKKHLAAMEWLTDGPGVRLKRPEEVLLRWATQQERVELERLECYSSLKPDAAATKIAIAMAPTTSPAIRPYVRHALCGQSAAWHIAPMVQPTRLTVYIDNDLLKTAESLGFKPVPNGGNVVLIRPRDAGVFYRHRIAEGVPIVGAVQAYLDCRRSGGRGEEAAEAILEQKLRPTW